MEDQIQISWNLLVEKLSGWFNSLVLSLPNFMIALIVFILAYWLARSLQGWVDRLLKKIIKQKSIRGLITNVFSIVVVILGILLALAVLNLDGTLKSLLAGAGVAGLAISLALQGTLANTFSGIFIALRDEINIGDFIESNGYSGKVVSVDLRNTKVKEPDNKIVVIPNKMILENPFRNYGLTKRYRATVNCGVGYETDLSEAKQLAVAAIENIYPPSSGENIEFFYTEFGDSSINFMLRFWVDASEKLTTWEVKSEAIMAIKKAYDDKDINIPFPIRTLMHEGNLAIDNKNVSKEKENSSNGKENVSVSNDKERK